MDNLLQMLEAIIFAAGVPVKRSDILNGLPEEISRKQLNEAIDQLAEKYSGDSGIVLEVFKDKVQFASNSKYGEIVSDMLRPVREKELSKILLEVLSLIAYRQPITRGEIEDCRGASADYPLSVLLKINMIKTCGFKDAPGKPILYGTTDDFLKKFEIESLDKLPDYEEVMRRLVEYSNYNIQTDGLYRERVIGEKFEDDDAVKEELDEMMDMTVTPEFLQGEELQVLEGNGDDYEEREVAADTAAVETVEEDEDGGEIVT
ncbi:MAG: SMC-Scp complex subunit ScpB [Clostridia bacterium]|nr:SMC-Scp complex subunit ScpB [Clostridia bacterium]MDE7328742.1 SMC-Scp complex subunit ScpB [Clostridia bacterium]